MALTCTSRTDSTNQSEDEDVATGSVDGLAAREDPEGSVGSVVKVVKGSEPSSTLRSHGQRRPPIAHTCARQSAHSRCPHGRSTGGMGRRLEGHSSVGPDSTSGPFVQALGSYRAIRRWRSKWRTRLRTQACARRRRSARPWPVLGNNASRERW